MAVMATLDDVVVTRLMLLLVAVMATLDDVVVTRLMLLLVAVMATLTKFSTTTSVLTDPSRLPQEAARAVLDASADRVTEIN